MKNNNYEFNALKAIPTGHSPGDDGITVEVWRFLFPIIGEYYVRMINTQNLKVTSIMGFSMPYLHY